MWKLPGNGAIRNITWNIIFYRKGALFEKTYHYRGPYDRRPYRIRL